MENGNVYEQKAAETGNVSNQGTMESGNISVQGTKETDSAYEQIGVAMTCRSFAEYERMFALSDSELRLGAVLDVAGGASSFTAEANALGYSAYAADPRYMLEPDQIKASGEQEIEESTRKLAQLEHHFVWDYYGNLQKHRDNRARALRSFVDDYRKYGRTDRYQAEYLPNLPYADGTFSLVLCSHFLFLYHDQFDYDFHIQSVLELLRVCRPDGEVRIYPLLTLGWKEYPHLQRLCDELGESGVQVEQRSSLLPFIPGSQYFLRLSAK